MGLLDKLVGRGKQAAGDVTGDTAMRQEGVHQERQAEAEDRAAAHEAAAQEEREQAAQHQAQRDQT